MFCGVKFLTAQMSVFTLFGVPHLLPAFQFVCGPGGGGGRKQNGRQVEGCRFFSCALAGWRVFTVRIAVFVGGPLLKTFVSR